MTVSYEERTRRGLRVLAVVAHYHTVHHYPPSILELTVLCEASSTSRIETILADLVTRGYLTRVKKIARSLHVTDRGHLALKQERVRVNGT